MPTKNPRSAPPEALSPASVPFADDGNTAAACPILLVADDAELATLEGLSAAARAWLKAQVFKAAARKAVFVPGPDGRLASVVLGVGGQKRNGAADPMARAELLLGTLPPQLPPGIYRLASRVDEPDLAAVAWGLGGYRFRRYKSGEAEPQAVLAMPVGANAGRVRAIVEGTAFGRDLVNTPSSDMGPAELELATHSLARRHGARVATIAGDDLLAKNFPLIHAVGRASPRAPRLLDLTWSGPDAGKSAPRITLVGKGICFDTGGLDLKPAAAMVLMKKDMGGAATALALGHMLMSAGLSVHLRILIAAAENAVAGNAFRPGDVITSRAGLTVEIGNTDAEGRLVLADALTLADADKPDMLLSFATLTGAARVALGPEVAPFYCDDDDFAAGIAAAGIAAADPLWRLPLWTAYEPMLDSPVADLNNVADGPFAGSVVAALFLRRFVRHARRFAHFDIYGWRPTVKPLGPKGGEAQAARAVFDFIAASAKTVGGDR